MKAYLEVLQDVLVNGEDRTDRTGTGVRSLFGLHSRYDLREGFPAVTTKRLAFGAVVGELIGFLRGYTNAADFRKLGCNIWDHDANRNQAWLANPNRKGEDDLGLIYGYQWRKWGGDQVRQLINGIKSNPYSRRNIVSAWNAGELDKMALPPCHVLFQVYVSRQYLDLQFYQRSCDLFLGVPFNIASYALLLSMIAQLTGYVPRYLIHAMGDAHVYHNHLQQANTQLIRSPLPPPRLLLKPGVKDIDDFTPEDITLLAYEHRGVLKGDISV